ncbi:MAG: phosphoglucosamine mutase [Thermoplasmata archaeon]|nr:phosphoglucosamine mutase [Thermoplasmata archaeon]
MGLFGSSGIRGVVGKDFTPELAMDIGAAVGSLYGRCVVGRDTRWTGEMFSRSLMAGLMAAGCDVWDAGVVATPTIAGLAADYDCGLMVTASHNPPEYNGVKFWNPDGTSFNTPQMRRLEEMIARRDFRRAKWDNVGRYHVREDAVAFHMDRIMRHIPSLKGLRVVVDPGNGSASLISPRLLRMLGCEVLSINANPDGSFPGRPSEPEEENLAVLKETVVSWGADIGLAHDGDADRMTAVDERGRFLGGDIIVLLFAREFAGRRVVVPVNATMAVDDMVKGKEGGEVFRCRVGDVYVTEKLKEVEGDFGAEPSATWTFSEYGYFPDGIYAAVRLARMALEAKDGGETLGALVDRLPRYPIYRKNVTYPPERRSEVVPGVYDRLRRLEGRITDVDGIRVDTEDGWVLVRASGTEPKFRITAESRSDARARELFDTAVEILDEVIGGGS